MARVLRRLQVGRASPSRTRGAASRRQPAEEPPQQPAAAPAAARSQPATRTAEPTGTAGVASASEQPARPRSPQAEGTIIRGVAAAIAANMSRSLAVPTATSFRDVPAKLLEVNRKVINGYRSRSGMGKVSFTHLIGYAVVRAIADAVPVMRNAYAEDADGKPRLIRNESVNLGIAVDVDKGDGTRSLVVPVIRDADQLDFAGFLAAYEELIRKVRANKLAVEDFQGANVSLTNPGTIGTVQSVPRLMPGQGVIVGVGRIDYPAEFEGADRANLSSLGISKVVTLTSTYDHRIIQGAESGLFLQRVHELLLGEHAFYDDVFSSLDMPYEAVRWRPDVNPIDHEEAMLHKQMQVATLIRVYRVRGHLIADLDPLHWKEPAMPTELDPFTYGLTIWDLDREFLTGGIAGREKMPLGELLGVLRDAYCRTVGIEYMHIQDTEEQRWIQSKVEGVHHTFDKDRKRRILERLNAAEAFEKFLATKYVGTKRYGLEGAESAIPILDEVISAAADSGLDSCVLGMAHRGRLNVLSNIIGKSYDAIFREFEGHIDPDSVQGSGDVKYHLGATGKYVSPSGSDIRLELAANPSHLEAVDPVVVGMTRAAEDQIDPPGSYPVLPLLLHGDAAFAGQGVVAETLAMSDITGYRVGGTIHLIINNQIGYTTAPEFARSSLYCSDVAKTVQAPIFHVNGDDPEACVRVARMAFEYRQKFHKDVVIDMWCYRRHGHNEGDDPSYTQPLMYKAIAERRSVRKLYVEALVKRGDITLDEAEQALADFQDKLQVAAGRDARPVTGRDQGGETTEAGRGAAAHRDRGLAGRPRPDLRPAHRLPRVVHRASEARPAVRRADQALRRRRSGLGDRGVARHRVATPREPRRAAGRRGHPPGHVQPAARRAHRLRDRQAVGPPRTPRRRRGDVLGLRLAAVRVRRARVRVRLCPGQSARAGGLGGAVRRLRQRRPGHPRPVRRRRRGQVGSEQRARAAPAPRLRGPGTGALVGADRALPHGRGRGQHPGRATRPPRRSTSTCCAGRCTASDTPRSIIFAPKVGPADEADQVADRRADERVVRGDPRRSVRIRSGRRAADRVLQRQGRVDAMAERDARQAPAAVVRLEQLYPLPTDQLLALLDRYPNARELTWVQEEPENMGAWNFLEHHVWRIRDRGYDLRHAARVESGSPATGSKTIHDQEHTDLMDATFSGL